MVFSSAQPDETVAFTCAGAAVIRHPGHRSLDSPVNAARSTLPRLAMPARAVPVPAGVTGRLHPGEILGRPDNNVRGADRDLLLASGTAIGLAGSSARNLPDQEVTIGRALGFPSAQWGRRTFRAFAGSGSGATFAAFAAQGTMGATGHPTTISGRRCGFVRSERRDQPVWMTDRMFPAGSVNQAISGPPCRLMPFGSTQS